MDQMSLAQQIVIFILPFLFAITLHEVAHGWVASLFGDQTARLSGRLTLNPLKHIDPIGTIFVPALLLLLKSGFIFGWAKPVPVDARNLRNPRRDMLMVSAAGPLSNILMALFWGLVAKGGFLLSNHTMFWGQPLFLMGQVGVLINAIFAVFNLLPLPPLDGGRLLVNLLPPRLGWYFARLEPYMFMILFLLIFTRVLTKIIVPPIVLLTQWITVLLALPPIIG